MSQALTQEGRFKARPKSWVVEENKNTGTLQLAITFGVLEAWTGENWEDWADADLEKTGWFYLVKKDGSPNEPCIRSLREALGWDGVNLEALQNTDWAQKVVQITTGFEDYQGQARLKVKFLNPENWEGAQAKPLDAAALKSLNSKWGAKLRSIAPKGAVKSAPKPAAAPAAPAAPPAPAVPAAPAAPAAPKAPAPTAPPPPPEEEQAAAAQAATKESAWAKVLEVFGGNAAMAKAEWTGFLKRIVPNKPSAQFTTQDWAQVESRASDALPI